MSNFFEIAGTMPVGNVVLLGLGVVFVGLISIVVLCSLMGGIVRLFSKKEKRPVATPVAPAAAPVAAPVAAIPNRGELVAAIACAVAEELGTDVNAIRIVSLKKI